MSFPQIELAIRDFAKRAAGRHADARGPRAAARSRSPTAACSARCSARRSSTRRRSASSACTRFRTASCPSKGQRSIRPMMYRRAVLRSPHRRRPRGGAVPGEGQGIHRGPGQPAAGELRSVRLCACCCRSRFSRVLAHERPGPGARSSRRPPDLRRAADRRRQEPDRPDLEDDQAGDQHREADRRPTS